RHRARSVAGRRRRSASPTRGSRRPASESAGVASPRRLLPPFVATARERHDRSAVRGFLRRLRKDGRDSASDAEARLPGEGRGGTTSIWGVGNGGVGRGRAAAAGVGGGDRARSRAPGGAVSVLRR